MKQTLTAIIADDEENLGKHLQHLLQQLWPELHIIALAENGTQALDLIQQRQPDITFLDIHMPGLSGIDVAKQIFKHTHIVFVTAYDEYAVDAFNYHAVDYLLKPVSKARLEQTIQRLKQTASQPQSLQAVIEQLAQQTSHKAPLQWLRLMHGDDIHLTHVDDVIYFKFEDKYTTVRTQKGCFLMRKSLKELEQELNPDFFWRIHRNTIVNIRKVTSVSNAYGQTTLKLKEITDELNVSRANKHLFKHM